MSTQINPISGDSEIAKSQIAAQAANDKIKMERGLIGTIFGARDHAPFNIAAMVIVVCVVIIAFLIIPKGGFSANKEALTYIGGFVTLTLGYIFGKSSS